MQTNKKTLSKHTWGFFINMVKVLSKKNPLHHYTVAKLTLKRKLKNYGMELIGTFSGSRMAFDFS